MGNILKTGKTIEDPRDSTKELAEAYSVIVQININHIDKTGLIVHYIYARNCLRKEREDGIVENIGSWRVTVTPTLYDEYIGIQNFQRVTNMEKQAYLLTASIEDEIIKEEKIDGEVVSTTIQKKRYEDWISDEEPIS